MITKSQANTGRESVGPANPVDLFEVSDTIFSQVVLKQKHRLSHPTKPTRTCTHENESANQHTTARKSNLKTENCR